MRDFGTEVQEASCSMASLQPLLLCIEVQRTLFLPFAEFQPAWKTEKVFVIYNCPINVKLCLVCVLHVQELVVLVPLDASHLFHSCHLT